MFKILEGVSFDGGPKGQAFGGGIYGVSCDVATSQDSSKITLNIVSADGKYAIDSSSLNVTSSGAKTLQMGSGLNAITFYNMYVYKYNYSQSSSSKTLSVTLIDHSIALDKVFLGLVARHNTDLAKVSTPSYPFSVHCHECNKLWPQSFSKTGSISRLIISTKPKDGIMTSGPGGIDGGYIILGEEQWTDGNCEIPKVEYTFSELCEALDALGYLHNLKDFDRSTFYQASYTGTLREVLNAWASDFSFSFVIDPFVPFLKIAGTDLTLPTDITKVKNALATGFSSASNGGLIRSRSDSLSLEGTYSQRAIVKNIKPARAFTTQKVSYQKMIGKPISVRDALGNSGDYGRTEQQLKISIALAKYKPEARLIWLSDQAAVGGVSNSCWKSLGFIPAKAAGAQGQYGISDPTIRGDILKLFQENADKNVQHPIWSNPDNYYVYIGVYNETLQRALESFDNELANFYNKYAYWYGKPFNRVTMDFNTFAPEGMTNPPPSFRECPDTIMPFIENSNIGNIHKFYDYVAKISTLPESKLYKLNSYPFQEILRTNEGVFSLTGGGADPDGDSIFNLDDNGWGTHPEHIDNLFANQWVYDTSNVSQINPQTSAQSDLEHFLPVFSRFNADNVLKGALRSILPNFQLDFIKTQDRLNGYFPGIAIVPKIEKMVLKTPLRPNDPPKRVLEVGNLIQQNNILVHDNTRRRRLEAYGVNGASEKECTVFCEQDIVSDVCECPAIEDPLHQFSGYAADAFIVKHLGNAATITFPIGSNYIGFWKSEVTMRGTYPKRIQVRGSPARYVKNVMETRVVDTDVTQDLDPVGNRLDDVFVIRNLITPTPIDLDKYYQELNNIDRDSTFPTESINVKIDGIEFDTLYTLIYPSGNSTGASNGLTGFSITMDSEGMSTDLTFSNRPAKPPKRDVIMQKVGPRATQGRTGGSRSTAVGGGTQSGVNMPFLP